jgi:aminoglycoside/choline kinase family phosphotransferase
MSKTTPQRFRLLREWLEKLLGPGEHSLAPASGDASFRRYWRVRHGERTYVVMDAPPGLEDTERFVRIALQWRNLGLNTPEVYAEDPQLGFVLLQDLGTRLYLDELAQGDADRLYGDALGALAVIQACGPVAGLPAYDPPFLRRELELFRDWLLGSYLDLALSGAEADGLAQSFDLLVASALEQPQVCVHRDFHSRNLMVTAPPSPGILDFQDAVLGPVTYDLVSLLRDCYIAWPEARVQAWAWGYFQLALQSGILRPEQEQSFNGWFDLMGVQRHLKASGIFARLAIRDDKPGYLADIPRTLGYVVQVAGRYPALGPLAELVGDRVLPAVRGKGVGPG